MIGKNKKEYIESLVRVIKQTLDIHTPITESKLKEIINVLGGKLEYTSDMIYGSNTKRTTDKFVVFINEMNTEEKQRFLIAHELGHLILHMKRLDEDYWLSNAIEDTAYFCYGRAIEELEADEFAKELLMPREEFITVYDEYISDDIIAKYFNVSSKDIYVRCKGLGL